MADTHTLPTCLRERSRALAGRAARAPLRCWLAPLFHPYRRPLGGCSKQQPASWCAGAADGRPPTRPPACPARPRLCDRAQRPAAHHCAPARMPVPRGVTLQSSPSRQGGATQCMSNKQAASPHVSAHRAGWRSQERLVSTGRALWAVTRNQPLEETLGLEGVSRHCQTPHQAQWLGSRLLPIHKRARPARQPQLLGGAAACWPCCHPMVSTGRKLGQGA